MIKYLPDVVVGLLIGTPIAVVYFVVELLWHSYWGGLV